MRKLFKCIFILGTILLTSCGKPQTSESLSEESIVESITESSEEESESTFVPASGTVEFYAINDFHGSVEPNGYEMGILKVGSYLKQRQEEENTVIINSGDFWQGSIQSNLNHGEYLTKINNEIGFDAMTLGNHEFDWGVSYIERNSQIVSETGFKTPFFS